MWSNYSLHCFTSFSETFKFAATLTKEKLHECNTFLFFEKKAGFRWKKRSQRMTQVVTKRLRHDKVCVSKFLIWGCKVKRVHCLPFIGSCPTHAKQCFFVALVGFIALSSWHWLRIRREKTKCHRTIFPKKVRDASKFLRSRCNSLDLKICNNRQRRMLQRTTLFHHTKLCLQWNSMSQTHWLFNMSCNHDINDHKCDGKIHKKCGDVNRLWCVRMNSHRINVRTKNHLYQSKCWTSSKTMSFWDSTWETKVPSQSHIGCGKNFSAKDTVCFGSKFGVCYVVPNIQSEAARMRFSRSLRHKDLWWRRPMTFSGEKPEALQLSKIKKSFFGIGWRKKMWNCWLYNFCSNFRKTQRTNTFLSSKMSFAQGSLPHTPWTCNIAWHIKNQN